MSKICVITAGHLSSCPRMLKAADLFVAAGHEVHVVSTNFEPWATAADEQVTKTRSFEWTVVDYSRESGSALRFRSGVRRKAALASARLLGVRSVPAAIAIRARSRVAMELATSAASKPADFVYGGGFALAATAFAAKKLNVPYGLDLEDFHSAEQANSGEGKLQNQLAEKVERHVVPGAALLTTASEEIAGAYTKKYGVVAKVINNTFPLPTRGPDLSCGNGEPLRLYWFSQTIGPDRGLEDCIRAVGLANIDCELHVRGKELPGYLNELKTLGSMVAPSLDIFRHENRSPDEMIDCCRGHHIGLALEQPNTVNHAIALSNKAFTYILAGLAVAFTDTPGQRALAQDLGEGALLFQPGDVERFATGLRMWAENRSKLERARRAAWAAAKRRWHWEHPMESGALLALVQKALGDKK